VGEQPIFIIGGERSTGHGEICAGGRCSGLRSTGLQKM